MARAKKIRAGHVSNTKMLLATLALALSGGSAFVVIPTISTTKYTCVDSDAGTNDRIFGALTITDKFTKRKRMVDDFCASRNVVMEGMCDAKNRNAYTQNGIKCGPNSVCNRGACVPEAPNYDLDLTKSSDSPVGPVLPGLTSAVLAKFTVNPNASENELRTLALSLATTSPKMLTGNFTVKVNDITVYTGPVGTISNSATNLTTLSLFTTVSLPANQQSTITVEAPINREAPNGAAVTVFLDIPQVVRAVNTLTHDPGTPVIAGNQMLVLAGTLEASTLLTSNPSLLIPAGTNKAKLAEFSFSAQHSGEDVTITQIVITDTISDGAYTDLNTLQLYDESDNPIGTVVTSNANKNTFSFSAGALTVQKNGTRTLTLKADVRAGISSVHTFSLTSGRDITAFGKTTSNIIQPSLVNTVGQPVTFSSAGTLTISKITGFDASPAGNQSVKIGQSDIPVFAFKMIAGSEPIKIRSLKLSAAGTAQPEDIRNIRLYFGTTSTPFASATSLLPSSSTPYFTWTSSDNLLPETLQPGYEYTVYVKADIADQSSAILGNTFRIGIQSASDIEAFGTVSNDIVSPLSIVGLPALANGVSSITPFSVSAQADAPITNNTLRQIIINNSSVARLKITNNGSVPITVTRIKLTDGGFHTGTAPTYKVTHSDQNFNNYNQNLIIDSQTGTDFSLGNGIRLDGHAYVYVTIAIRSINGGASGDSFRFSVANVGDIQYRVHESDLGYDANGNGKLSDTIHNLWIDSNPVFGTLIKN